MPIRHLIMKPERNHLERTPLDWKRLLTSAASLEVEVDAGVGEGVEAGEDVGSGVGQQMTATLSSHSYGGVSHCVSNGVGHGVSQAHGGAGVSQCMSHRVGSYGEGGTRYGEGSGHAAGKVGQGGGGSAVTQTSKLKWNIRYTFFCYY